MHRLMCERVWIGPPPQSSVSCDCRFRPAIPFRHSTLLVLLSFLLGVPYQSDAAGLVRMIPSFASVYFTPPINQNSVIQIVPHSVPSTLTVQNVGSPLALNGTCSSTVSVLSRQPPLRTVRDIVPVVLSSL